MNALTRTLQSPAHQRESRAVDKERDPHVMGFAIMPAFRPLCADPRFETLAREMGLIA